MRIDFNTNSIDDYERFLKIRSLPTYQFHGTTAVIPDEYAEQLGIEIPKSASQKYLPGCVLYDYQEAISEIAIRKRKYAVFMECGLGKTLILLEFAFHAVSLGKKTLIVSPLMVCEQTASECQRFYGRSIDYVPAARLQEWLDGDEMIGITNYEAIRDGLTAGKLGALILDESSMLKSAYGKWGQRLIKLGRGLEYKLALTGTPAPNDRIEFANHAVFLDQYQSVNSFLARYFVNRGQTQNRWELKEHALRPFYRSLSHWCIFVTDPSVYGWKDNTDNIPPIHIHIDDVPMTKEQVRAVQSLTGGLCVTSAGGIGTRGKLSQIAKGQWEGKEIPTNKYSFMKELVSSWPDESTLIWCNYNAEQDAVEDTFPGALSIAGKTPHEDRMRMISDFQSGENRIMISKPKVLGFGLNLQIATRQVFSGLKDSWEEFHQAVKRSNRIGSTRPLNVHIPITEIEEPMITTVLAKADRIEKDTKEQQELFKQEAYL